MARYIFAPSFTSLSIQNISLAYQDVRSFDQRGACPVGNAERKESGSVLVDDYLFPYYNLLLFSRCQQRGVIGACLYSFRTILTKTQHGPSGVGHVNSLILTIYHLFSFSRCISCASTFPSRFYCRQFAQGGR